MTKKFYNEDIAKLILRITCGGLLFLHGSHSVTQGIQHVKDSLRNNGLPEFISYGNYIGEFIAPIFLIIGFKSRIAALIIVFNMLASVLLAHRDIMFSRHDFGGLMIELNVFYMMTAIAVFFCGSGKYSLSRGRGAWD
jgi:putative oxidoreductase